MDVDKLLARADTALRKRQADQALMLYRQALLRAPGHGPARTGYLTALRRRADLKGGPSLLDRAAARSLRAAAAGFGGAHQHAALVKSCETGLERDPFDLALLSRLAGALEALDRPEEALATWTYRLALDQDDVEALKSAGRIHYDLRQIPEAQACLERAHAANPHDPEVERLRKHLAAEGTLAATSYATATSSRDVAKDTGERRRAGGAARASGGDEDPDVLARVLAADPEDRDAHRALALSRRRAGDTAGALTAAREALARWPDDEALLELQSELLLSANEQAMGAARASGDAGQERRLRTERARIELEALERRSAARPEDPLLRVRLGKARLRAGETEAAIECFQAVASDARVERDARQGLGAAFYRQGLYPLARRQLEQALELTGGVTGDRGKEICYHLGLVCERLEDAPGALARYMEVYEVDIHYKDVAAKIEQLS